ncbi:Aste57867_19619 [Aphanomyces stellatus]|uniref:Aste57867_19619 protein n=1 Tax=Aphanomyces stellatus TaxID=120398 RepID=A0A485LD57_9STRA|nr:hypothetical protein As57867_019555 [Aphanomyces stellatus]VFT96319.1 Aste57867_19619 [Aphanomyces stellatus]
MASHSPSIAGCTALIWVSTFSPVAPDGAITGCDWLTWILALFSSIPIFTSKEQHQMMSQSAEETEVFLRDLQFLIATDEQVEDDFAQLCALLDDKSDSDEQSEASSSSSDNDSSVQHPTAAPLAASAPPKSKPGRGRNPYEHRQREELKSLKAQVDTLKRELASTKASTDATRALVSRKRGASPWEVAARDELLERNRALAENKQLKDAIADQATFVEQMQSLFLKKPRLVASCDPTSEAWQAYKLAAQQSLRVGAIHAIADRQRRRVQHAMIQASLFQAVDVHRLSATPRVQADGTSLLELKGLGVIPLPCHIAGLACWRAICRFRPVTADAVYATDEIDDHTVYETFSTVVQQRPVHSNMIRKYYPDATQHVVVWRTVLEDALVPHMTRGAVDNKWGWLVAAPLPEDASNSTIKFLFYDAGDTDHASWGEEGSESRTRSLATFKCLEEVVKDELARTVREFLLLSSGHKQVVA